MEVLGVEDITQVAQTFAAEVVRFEVVRGDERLYVGVYVEGAAVGGDGEGGEHRAEFAVRTFIAVVAISVDVRCAGFIEEPTDRTQQLPHGFPPAGEVVGYFGQDVVDLADMFVRVSEGAALVTSLGVKVWAFGHRWK